MARRVRQLRCLLLCVACQPGRPETAPPAARVDTASAPIARAAETPRVTSPGPGFRLKLCSEAPAELPDLAGTTKTRSCVVRYEQRVDDPAYVKRFGTEAVERRYLVYAPEQLPPRPLPVVFVFPGATASAEVAAVYQTRLRFETLADRDGFIVVYGNGLPYRPFPEMEAPIVAHGGYFLGCLAERTTEGIDVSYVRQILTQLESELSIDRTRVYAAGMSAGGGLAFELALEAPDLVAAIAPVTALPFQPAGEWRMFCRPAPGHDLVSIAMLAATGDPLVSYEPGASKVFRNVHYPGMEATRDAWLAALGIAGLPKSERLPDRVLGDSYEPHTGVTDSTIEKLSYPAGPRGQEFLYYKAVAMGHWWPNPEQLWSGLWERFGKTNQDIDFADQAWEFFQRHRHLPE